MFNYFKSNLILLIMTYLLSINSVTLVFADSKLNEKQNNEINSINYFAKDRESIIKINGARPFVSTSYELPNPRRIVIDIADVTISNNAKKIQEIPFKYSIDTIPGSNPSICRFEFNIDEFDSFNTKNENETLILTINNPNINIKNTKSENNIKDYSELTSIKYLKQDSEDLIRINFNKRMPIYNISTNIVDSKYTLQIDLDEVNALESDLGTISSGGVIEKIVSAKRGSGIRVLIISKNDQHFTHKIKESSLGLELVITPELKANINNKLNNKEVAITSQLPDIKPLESKISPQAREQQMQDAFNFSGYNKERITVEFQKMDLHNVFNFLRQVSGVNIVVDESVQGSLTLVLDDVPWDFALDIILNLKDLEKEERFNTIVISPKGKGFTWPEQAANNLSFQADSSVIEKESLVVQQQEKQTPDRVEAKQFLSKAQSFEQSEDYEQAVGFYEQAFEKWNDNVSIANKISSIYLVQLRQNAKALYYAQKSLTIDPNNQSALIQAGIASANMQNNQEAEKFFQRSIKSSKPSKEALLNYAAFLEGKNNYSDSLSILNRHDQQYGKSMDSMLAAARLNDKSGNAAQAVRCYRELINSGYRMPSDLQKFIQERITR